MEPRKNKVATYVSKVIDFAVKSPLYVYLPLSYVLLMVLLAAMLFIGESAGLPKTDYSKLGLPDNIWYRYLLVVLFGPLLETFFFQAMPYYFLNLFEFMKKRAWLSILIPSIVFGCLHDYSIQYIFLGIAMGFVFQFTYHFRSKKGDPFLSTYLLHVLLNGVSVTLQYFFV